MIIHKKNLVSSSRPDDVTFICSLINCSFNDKINIPNDTDKQNVRVENAHLITFIELPHYTKEGYCNDFSSSLDFSKSSLFTQSNPHQQTLNFTQSNEFTKSSHFSESSSFSESNIFSKTDYFYHQIHINKLQNSLNL